MATVVRVKGCPKCGGDLYAEKDSYGPYVACLQCGSTNEAKITNPPPPVKEVGPHQEPTTRKANRDVKTHHDTKFCPVHETEVVYARGVCKTCWENLYRKRKKCSEEGCTSWAQRGGLCRKHFNKQMQGVLV